MTACTLCGSLIDAANNGHTEPLMDSARYGHTDCVQLLLDAGADYTLQNKEDKTSLALAIEHEHKECIQILKEWNDTALLKN